MLADVPESRLHLSIKLKHHDFRKKAHATVSFAPLLYVAGRQLTLSYTNSPMPSTLPQHTAKSSVIYQALSVALSTHVVYILFFG
ncbi:unnamed protein product [Blumeria hordei]|uniref:Uncharacterized protein n=1 Tax=Blumeria hordei TaxID=2867405 RepID=A0A383UWS9_BLUHO|nr:unnamed protein product [Blumeria hordei]